MPHTSEQDSVPPPSLAASVAQATVQIAADHKDETSGPQKFADRLTALIGRPVFVVVFSLVILAWVGTNLAAARLGYRPPDPPPFIWLQGATTIGTMFVAALILTTQRREDQLANHRSQLILELIIVNDQKNAKIIELLEEVRRDNPAIADRIDSQAAAMSAPSDTLAVLGAIKGSDTKPDRD